MTVSDCRSVEGDRQEGLHGARRGVGARQFSGAMATSFLGAPAGAGTPHTGLDAVGGPMTRIWPPRRGAACPTWRASETVASVDPPGPRGQRSGCESFGPQISAGRGRSPSRGASVPGRQGAGARLEVAQHLRRLCDLLTCTCGRPKVREMFVRHPGSSLVRAVGRPVCDGVTVAASVRRARGSNGVSAHHERWSLRSGPGEELRAATRGWRRLRKGLC